MFNEMRIPHWRISDQESRVKAGTGSSIWAVGMEGI